ncbi:EpsI family protein [Duganella sp. FT3S]|uniref:EpsI family protein n=1 Tax=Rugamonas fusca TaxID=2758568 RepID=A0A7W2EKJ3_9BURK|nr:exosortase-associated protein EpsI, B-type [Rugamonas fusca]MBA5607586.1 EpsI family protein [Rugamonas fusca]
MSRMLRSSVAIGGAMLLTVALAKVATPVHKLADSRPMIDLQSAIPSQFGDWREDRNLLAEVVNPTAAAELQRIYAQTLMRTYVNRDGERVMLSVAYGRDQTDSLSVHFPEGCYGGQGFAVGPTTRQPVAIDGMTIPMARLVASSYNRNEPVSYWIVVGDRAVNNSWDMKLAKLSYAMHGFIADATLMRVSNITLDNERGYQVQQQFVGQMLAAMPPALRYHFAGAAR